MREHLIGYEKVAELSDKYNEFYKNKPSKAEIDQFLKENFQFIRNEYEGFYGFNTDATFDKLWAELSEEEKRELARPLSKRQRFSFEGVMNETNEDVYWNFWDFLDDYGRIYSKKYMSTSEIVAMAIMLERIYTYLV